MSERSTRTIKTPLAEIEVVLHDYMTGGEMMDLEAVAVGSGVKSVDGRSGEVQMRADEAYKKRLRKLADVMIVSIGGETDPEKRWTALRALQARDYAFVMKEVEAAAAGISESEGKA